MPITWEFRDDVLVLKYIGNPSTDERRQAIAQAMADAAFREGLLVLFDLRSSISSVSAEELRQRVDWAAGLSALGFRPRYAILADPHREGIARLGVQMLTGRVEVRKFNDPAEALAWLREIPASAP